MNNRNRFAAALALCLGCNSERPPAPRGEAPSERTPDRLEEDEQLPAAETAFGLPIPSGMQLTRHFNDTAYFSGPLKVNQVLEHIQANVMSREVEMMSQRVVFSRAYIKGDESKRLVRIEIAETPEGSQVYLRDITPPPSPRGLSEEERWSRAGRKPDGTPLNPNQLY
jgi:hypothetical protein